MRLIDADALTEKLGISEKCDCCQYNSMDNCEKELYFAEACCEIYNAPTVVTHPKWIPCSERLPEIGEYVLCSQDNGDVGEGLLSDYGSWLICYDQTLRGSYWVNAWMPLPEPYKGE